MKEIRKIGVTLMLMLVLALISGCAQTVDIVDADIPLSGPDEVVAELNPEEGAAEPAFFEMAVETVPEPDPGLDPEPAVEPEPVQEPVEQPAPVEQPKPEPEPAKEPEPVSEEKPEPEQEPAPDNAPDDVTDEIVEAAAVLTEYTATFLNEDGSVFISKKVTEGDVLTKPSDVPEKEKHAFSHWFENGAGQQPYSFGAVIQADITLMPCFEPIEVEDTQSGEPTEEEGTENIDEAPLDTAQVQAEVNVSFDGDYLIEGTVITLSATLSGVTEGENITVQWQNNASGEFADVPGAMGLTYSFQATEETTGCQWQAILLTYSKSAE